MSGSETLEISKDWVEVEDGVLLSKLVDREESFVFDYAEYLDFVEKLKKAGIVQRPIMASELRSQIDRRAAYKKEMKKYADDSAEFMSWNIKQASVKLVSLASYGAAGYKNTRFYNDTFFNAVTVMSRHVIQWVERFGAPLMGFEFIYGDTDSVFAIPVEKTSIIELAESAYEVSGGINTLLFRYLRDTFKVGDITIELEPKTVYEAIVFTSAKKKYRGDTVWIEGSYERKVQVVGFEAMRSDAFGLQVDVQTGIQDILFNTDPDELEEMIVEYLREKKVKLFMSLYDSGLVQEKTLRKTRFEDYQHEDPHVRAAKKLDKMGAFRPGDRVAWVTVAQTKDQGYIEEPIDPSNPTDIPHPQLTGYEYYWRRIMDMVERLLGYRPAV